MEVRPHYRHSTKVSFWPDPRIPNCSAFAIPSEQDETQCGTGSAGRQHGDQTVGRVLWGEGRVAGLM